MQEPEGWLACETCELEPRPAGDADGAAFLSWCLHAWLGVLGFLGVAGLPGRGSSISTRPRWTLAVEVWGEAGEGCERSPGKRQGPR